MSHQPKPMQTIEVNEQQLILTQRSVPVPNAEQVLIEVKAAGVNRADILQRQGLYPPPEGAPDILGLEVAGIIAAVGEKVSTWRVGDKVCALVSGGGYAQFCAADSSTVLPLPDSLDFVHAAGIPETFFTVWSTVFELAKLQAGETLLVHGGSSGIGTTAIQLAKAFGSRIFVTVGTDEKLKFCQNLGADVAINYREQDFVSEIARLTDGKGVNVILDSIGGDYFMRNLKSLAMEGRLVQIGLQQGYKTDINLVPVLTKRLSIIGSTLRNRELKFKAAIAQNLRQQVWPLLNTGQITPVIHAAFPLHEAAKAHQLMESSQHLGKIILVVD